MNGLVKQCRRALYGVHNIKSVTVRLIVYVEIFYYVDGFFLNNNLVEHHRAAPHSAAGRQLAVKLRHLQAGLCKIISCYNARRAAANDCDIEVEISFQLLEIGTDDTL